MDTRNFDEEGQQKVIEHVLNRLSACNLLTSDTFVSEFKTSIEQKDLDKFNDIVSLAFNKRFAKNLAPKIFTSFERLNKLEPLLNAIMSLEDSFAEYLGEVLDNIDQTA